MFTERELISFAVFAVVMVAAGLAAGFRPRVFGHVMAVVFGLCNIALAAVLAAGGMTLALIAALTITGGLLPVLAWLSYFRRSRAAWAFMLAICGVYPIFQIFGAMKAHNVLDIGLWYPMIWPGLKIITVVALINIRRDYGTAAPATATAAA